MINLMIVDDDVQIREGISKGIKWSDIGIDNVAAFQDGIDALEAFDVFLPDILVTDVKMAQMNGIELLREAKKLNPQIKVILISGFSDFEYVQKALQLGASDYELKPVSARVLLKKVSSLKDEILKEKTSDSMLEEYKQEYCVNTFESILLGKIDNYFILKDFFETYYGLKNFYDFVMLMVVDDSQNEINLSNIMSEKITSKQDDDFCYVSFGNKHIVLVSVPNSLLIVNLKRKELKDMFLEVTKQYDMRISAIISTNQPLKNISNVFKTLDEGLIFKFYEGPGVCLLSEEKKRKNNDEEIKEIMRRIKEKTSTSKEFMKCLKKLADCYSESYAPSPEAIKQTFIEIITYYAGKEVCTQLQKELGVGLEKSVYLCELIETVKRHMKIIEKTKTEHTPTQYSHVINTALSYIHEHYCEQITIETVSEYVEKSPNYFSSIFNKEVGKPYTKYLNKLRINRAKHLLNSTKLPLTEIATMTGYTDYTYFISVFKKIEGCTPSAIRKGGAE